MDTELVEKKVQDICKKISMTEKEKEKLRLNLMTKGLNTGSTGLGRGRRVPQTGRGRPPLAKIPKTVSNKTIKCDMCKKEFPHNVDESVLINHIKTVHMNKKSDEVSNIPSITIASFSCVLLLAQNINQNHI